MGQDYRARDTRLDRTVAIKISKQEFRERLSSTSPVSIVARMRHPEDVHDLAVNPCTNDPIIGRKRMSQSARTEA